MNHPVLHDSVCQMEVYSQYVKKSIALAGNWLQVSYLFAAEVEGVFCTEINLAMPSCDGWGDAIFIGTNSMWFRSTTRAVFDDRYNAR